MPTSDRVLTCRSLRYATWGNFMHRSHIRVLCQLWWDMKSIKLNLVGGFELSWPFRSRACSPSRSFLALALFLLFVFVMTIEDFSVVSASDGRYSALSAVFSVVSVDGLAKLEANGAMMVFCVRLHLVQTHSKICFPDSPFLVRTMAVLDCVLSLPQTRQDWWVSKCCFTWPCSFGWSDRCWIRRAADTVGLMPVISSTPWRRKRALASDPATLDISGKILMGRWSVTSKVM